MKLQEIHFKHPVKIITIFRNINIYGKAKKSFEDRKDEMAWREIPSKSGYIKDGELYLPEEILNNINFKTCGLITIEDDNQPTEFRPVNLIRVNVMALNTKVVQNHCFNLRHLNKIDIFEIKFKDDFELFLQYNYFEIGIPARENFKLCTLKKNQPVEIKINGKTDFSMTSGRERVFKEQFYIIEYVGDFDQCKILKEPFNPIIKQVPSERKPVDLLKPLW